MKKTSKISGITVASVLIFLGLYFVFGFSAIPEFHEINSCNSGKKLGFFSDQANPFSYTLPEKTSAFTYFNYTDNPYVYGHKLTPGIINTYERFLSGSFARYCFLSLNFPIRLRKANLLFPFHNFW